MLAASKRASSDLLQRSSWLGAGHGHCGGQLHRCKGARVHTQAADIAHPALFQDSGIVPEASGLQLPAAVTAAVAAVTSSIDEIGTSQPQQHQRSRQRQRLFGQNGTSSNGSGPAADWDQQQQQDDEDAATAAALSEQISDRIASNLSASSSYDYSDSESDASHSNAAAAGTAGSTRTQRTQSSSIFSYEQRLQPPLQQQQTAEELGRFTFTEPRSQRTVNWYREQANRRLTWHITHAQDLTALRQIMRQYEGNFNHIHVNALFGRLAKLVVSRQLRPLDMLALHNFVPQVLQLVAAAVPEFDERCISNTLYGLAVLELYQERELLSALLAAAERATLSTFKPQGLANTAWALATLHLNPGPRLSQQLLASSNSLIAKFKPLELAQLGWAVGTLRIRVSESWGQAWRAAVGRQLGDLTPQGLSMVLWGAVRMWEVQQTLQPSLQFVTQQENSALHTTAVDSVAAEHSEWLTAVEASVQSQLQHYTPHSLSICLWGLARLGYKPSRAFTSTALEAVQPQLITASPSDLAILLYGLAAIGFLPGREWLVAYGQALKRASKQLTVRQVSNLLWAHGRLGVGPQNPAVLDKLMKQMYYGMQSANARDLANSLWGLAAIGAQPEKRWMSIFGAQAEALIHNFNPQEVANLLWAYATLNYKPPHMLLVALWEGVGIGSLGSSNGNVTAGLTTARLSAFKPQELSMLVWALAKLRAVPGKEWWEQFLQASYHKMQQQSPQGLANIIWALSELGLQPPPAWLYHWAAATRGVLSQMDPVDLGQVAAALQSPVLEPLQLPKLESLLLDVLDRLATVELQSGAYSKAAVELLMRMTAADDGTGFSSNSSSNNGNGRQLLGDMVGAQQQADAAVAEEEMAEGSRDAYGAVDSEVQQLKRLLSQQSLAEPPRRPSAAV